MKPHAHTLMASGIVPDDDGKGLDALGRPAVDPAKVRQLDSIANIPDIRRVGATYAAQHVTTAHFPGFVGADRP